MRLTGLLALLLFVLIVFFAAPAASYAQTANAPGIKTDNADSNPAAILPGKPQLDRELRISPPNEHPILLAQPLIEHGGDLVLRESPEEDDGLCYNMRTYVVAREDKASDTTHLVREVKCTPARKFGFKTADIKVESPADTKPATK